jgi:hypothetical protein
VMSALILTVVASSLTVVVTLIVINVLPGIRPGVESMEPSAVVARPGAPPAGGEIIDGLRATDLTGERWTAPQAAPPIGYDWTGRIWRGPDTVANGGEHGGTGRIQFLEENLILPDALGTVPARGEGPRRPGSDVQS